MLSFGFRRRGLVLGLLFASALAIPAQAEKTTATTNAAATALTFAAASLTNAVQDIEKAWEAKGNPAVKLSFAASSDLARQIEAGAPAAIFASANVKWMDYLEKKEMIISSSRVTPIGNALVLVTSASSDVKPVEISKTLDLSAMLGKDGRIVTGLVDSVPAGIYAKTALTTLGLWESVKARIVGASSVRAALALVERGEASFGIVYATDAAIAKNVKVIGTFPAGSHPPVQYPFALIKGHDTPEARDFFTYLTGPEAKDVYKKYGFSIQ
ncbi:molybdate ABC transporter substrate-binding protein [Xanthobacter sp. TB0139]|uniref:molybdate ABC transporter substrate-binding protein n=1 Tax=Xanthobacter sp. TB0139 TaxID=3459178 RepID=UPI00403961E1